MKPARITIQFSSAQERDLFRTWYCHFGHKHFSCYLSNDHKGPGRKIVQKKLDNWPKLNETII